MRSSHLLLRRRPFAPRAQQQPPSEKISHAPGEQQKQQRSSSSPFDEIERIRKVKRAGLGLSAAVLVGSAAAVAAGSGGPASFAPELLDVVDAAATASVALAAAAGLSLAAAKLSLGERLHLEVEGPRLFVEVLPEFDPSSPSVSSSSSSASSSGPSSLRPDGRPYLVVRDAGDGRGRGVYVRERTAGAGGEKEEQEALPLPTLPRGSFLGCYEGDLLSERDFWERYPGGVGDYCIGCGGGFCLDGAPLARELLLREQREGEEQQQRGAGREEARGGGRPSRFSPCLINHSSRRANVKRITVRRERRVELYASRDLLPGEELLLDYGRKYWRGREAEERD